jgi:hypothetical protein
MADIYSATPGTGYDFAADEIGGVLYPRVKLVTGADNSAADVSTASPLPVQGSAADDAAASGNPVPIGGVYQSTVDAVDAGDVGRLRMTARRALVGAADFRQIPLTSAAPAPAGSDIVNSVGGAIVSGDLEIRDNSYHTICIPLAISGWRKLNVGFFVSSGTVYDQNLALTVYGGQEDGLSWSILSALTIPSGGVMYFGVGNGAVGQGGVTGGATASNAAFYSIPALESAWPWVNIYLKASVAPTSGALSIVINRST